MARGEKVRVLDNLATGHWGLLKRAVKDACARRSDHCRHSRRRSGSRRDGGHRDRLSRSRAGSVPRSVENPIESDEVNVHGTVVVLDQRAQCRRAPSRSSQRPRPPTATPLPSPRKKTCGPPPMSPYAVSKLTCEHYLRVFASLYGLETLNLRYFNVFGPGQLPEGAYAAAIPRFVRAALTGEPDYRLRRRRADPRFLLHRERRSRQPPGRRDHQQARRRGREHRRRPAHLRSTSLLRENRAAARQEARRSVRRSTRRRREGFARRHHPRQRAHRIRTGGQWEDGLAPTIAFMRELLERSVPTGAPDRRRVGLLGVVSRA